MECTLATVLVETSDLSVVFGQGLVVGAGVILATVPIRLLLDLVRRYI